MRATVAGLFVYVGLLGTGVVLATGLIRLSGLLAGAVAAVATVALLALALMLFNRGQDPAEVSRREGEVAQLES